jgi:hypothetical protein
MKIALTLSPLLALALFPPAPSAQVGWVVRSTHINKVSGGFGGFLRREDEFGSAVAGMGDIDGDGIADLAVGARGDNDGGDDRGAVWILFLDADGTVKTQSKISQTEGNFPGTLADEGYMGGRLARISDLDGDGIAELAVVSGNPYRLWILRLDANGHVKGGKENLYTDPAFDPPTEARLFGNAEAPGGVADIGDLDGDGLPEIALGAPLETTGYGGEGALWILHLDAAGGYRFGHKIANGLNGMPSLLLAGVNFGGSITRIGDLDGDGRRELAVTSPFCFSGNGVWTLSLDANDHVTSARGFAAADYGLAWPSHQTWGTSHELAWLGDLDGDGLGEIALGFGGWDFPGGPHNEGGFAVGFQRADGSVSKRVRVSDHSGGFGELAMRTRFGQMISPLGDLDGDGTLEIAVGASADVSNGVTTGGVWILSLATTAVRNGRGVNPVTLSQASPPTWGSTWSATLDCTGHAAGLAFVFGYSQPAKGLLTSVGELLVSGSRTFWLQSVHNSGPTTLQATLPPYSVALIDLPVYIQGACTGAPGIQLSNALDVVIGR